MAVKGGQALQSYNMELVQNISELQEKRDHIKKLLQAEEEEKLGIQRDIQVLTRRLAEIDGSLARKYAYTNEYDKTINEVEVAYSKILESSQALLHVLKNGAQQVTNGSR